MFKKLLLSFFGFIFLLASPSAVSASTLSLSPANGSYARGCTFQVQILLDTQGVTTDGTDAYIRFNPQVLTPSQVAVNPGSLYSTYPTTVDAASGKIDVSGIADVSTPYSGSGTFATLSFQVNPNAPVAPFTISFDYDQQDTAKLSDSNVIDRSNQSDTLASVTNGQYNVSSSGGCGVTGGTSGGSTGTSGTGTGTGGPGAVGAASGSAQLNPTPIPYTSQLPNSGALENTLVLAFAGTIFVLIGAVGLKVFR